MNNFGFWIKKICVIGKNIKSAIIKFDKGLNIISGPSDTGKSYIFECINYMLGSSSEPKKIKEAKGYSDVLMEIQLYSGESYTLKRSFGSDDVDVYPETSQLIKETKPTKLKLKHDKENTNNLSVFYLEKSGYNHPVYVKKNKKGDNRTLSFRDFPLYIAISEDKVIKSCSPILSGQHITPTVEKSIFNFLVSGVDDSNNSNEQDINTFSTTKLEGQMELLDRLIAKEEMKLKVVTLEELLPKTTLEDRMNEIQIEFENINDEIEHQTEIRRDLWNKLEGEKSKIISDWELIKRFKLLKNYYDTDLERLSFVGEGNHYFSQLNFSKCPYCNQTINDECEGHSIGFNKLSEELFSSIEVEMNKIKVKLSDLESTIEQAEYDYNNLKCNLEDTQDQYNSINEVIVSILQPKQLQLKELLSSYIKARDLFLDIQSINKKIEDLNEEKMIVLKQLKNKSKTTTVKDNDNNGKVLSAINNFCKYMSQTLTRWKFSSNPEVLFKDGSFFIDSKPTQDYGKGYRAIIYSGFAISLMQFCKTNDMPHPGFVVLDSPLTTYKGKKSLDDISEDIQSAFFKDVALSNGDFQIIILDNKEPNDEVKEEINYIEFTRDINNGRYGFFPVN